MAESTHGSFLKGCLNTVQIGTENIAVRVLLSGALKFLPVRIGQFALYGHLFDGKMIGVV